MLNIDIARKLENIQTPFWYYDIELLNRTIDTVKSTAAKYDIDVHYAIKANAEERILNTISAAGLGADCVSGNEVLQAAKCGFKPEKIVYAGVGKTDKEIYDALNMGIFAFNCESIPEIEVINEMAGAMGVNASIFIRINPNIDAHTHKKITTGLFENKFGISEYDFEKILSLNSKCRNITINGLHFHIGSQITEVESVFRLECETVNGIVEWFESRGMEIRNIDLGGGLGIDYQDPDGHPVPDFEAWMRVISESIKRRPDQRVHIEPGRSIVAQCCSLLTKVLFVKECESKTFLIVDAGMNNLIRPALYDAYHKIENLSVKMRHISKPVPGEDRHDPHHQYDVVGPVCESSDVWGVGRFLPYSVRGDLMAIRSAGAYGQVMESKYNLRDLAPVVWSDRLDSATQKIDYMKLATSRL